MGERPPLTRRQALILDTIRAAVRDRGYPPSLRELCALVGISSSSTASENLRVLEARGYIRRTPNTPRGIMVLSDPEAPVLEDAGVSLNMGRHHPYGSEAYVTRNTCPGCKAPSLNTTIGVTKVAYTIEVCTCRDENHTYDHLVEQLWHRACLTVSGCP